MAEDDFEPRLGRIGKDPSFRGALRRAVNLAGVATRTGGRSRFVGGRIGRGSAYGALFASGDPLAGSRTRRVVVKVRFVKLAGKGARAAAAHLRYLQREGTTPAGERGELYGPDSDEADGKAFLGRGAGDRHQFRFIVSAEDGAEYDDLKPLVRRWMAQAEKDLGTRLEWIAVDHFDTGHPHSHVLVRGKDDRGQDLVIARDYLSHGLRERAAGIVSLDLGPRSDREIVAADTREITLERLTGIDRRLLREIGPDGLVGPAHRDRREQSLRAGRIGMLVRMGLAHKAGHGRWRLDDALEPTLRAMERRGDIIATLNHAARARDLDAAPGTFAIYDPGDARCPAVVGRVVERGLAEHDEDRAYLVVDGIDGRAHYVDCGAGPDPAGEAVQGSIVRVIPAVAAARPADHAVVAIAEEYGGLYSAELHALSDPGASERFIAAHVRRLEALRRLSGAVTRDADGLWHIAPDHLNRAQAYERIRSDAEPVRVTVLSDRTLDQLTRHDGITVLDEDPDLANADRLGGGFGRKVSDALARRRQWLGEQGLTGADTVEELRRREFARVVARLARETDRTFVDVSEGERVGGIYCRSVQVGTLRMAVIDDGTSFALVPWRGALERQIGREVSGVVRGRDVDWSFGRQRSGPGR